MYIFLPSILERALGSSPENLHVTIEYQQKTRLGADFPVPSGSASTELTTSLSFLPPQQFDVQSVLYVIGRIHYVFSIHHIWESSCRLRSYSIPMPKCRREQQRANKPTHKIPFHAVRYQLSKG